MDDLRDPDIRARLATIWTNPLSLNPARENARVTREIADRLANVSKELEKKHSPEDVAHFLMRCIFTMFAEDVDLLPKGEFTKLLMDCLDRPASFAPLLDELWSKMDESDYQKRFFSAFKQHLKHFNGNLFRAAKSFPLGQEEIGELLAAAKVDWTRVEPAIFGTLLERALDAKDRSRLGAHYTPRLYVERIVQVAVMEPLRVEWRDVQIKMQEAIENSGTTVPEKEKGQVEAIAFARAFHHRLCETRVLDPACGTGNFLYVALELMKALEGEVLEKLAELGFEQLELERETVDPHQFLGLELNPRAAAIAELVIWIGALQQHYRIKKDHPLEPILKAFKNINFGERKGYDAVLTWDEYPTTRIETKNGQRVETAPNARRPIWPDAEFIVGNPPFIGGKDIRAELGDFYTETLRSVHQHMNDSADFVMYWWDRAAELLTRKDTGLRRFGFITTNSITQVFQRRVTERHLNGKEPISLIFAIADHPWTKATKDAAAVRIAMTVAEKGTRDGVVLEVLKEAELDTDTPKIDYARSEGRINSDLTIGVDVAKAAPLLANEGLCSRGIPLHGAGFLVSKQEAEYLGYGRVANIEKYIRNYRNGRDLMSKSRDLMVIDLHGLEQDFVRSKYPLIYQHLYEKVKPERDTNREEYRRINWWLFGRPNTMLREAISKLPRYIATVETSKHRVFQFLDADILPDNMLVAIAHSDNFIFSILCSCIHREWTAKQDALLGLTPRYTKSRCFDPFPFPEASEANKRILRDLGEELDATRKIVLKEHPDLTMTGLYNVLEKIKAGETLSADDEDVKQRGRVLILKDLHDAIDRASFDAYGWPHDLSEQEILARLVALNAERRLEEERGLVRWLRPDYQAPRFGKGLVTEVATELDFGATIIAIDKGLPAFPKDRFEQPLAVKLIIERAGRPLTADSIARAFKGPHKTRLQRVEKIIGMLVRYGDVVALADGRVTARLAA
jgi:SAM-dependent methyltransferase